MGPAWGGPNHGSTRPGKQNARHGQLLTIIAGPPPLTSPHTTPETKPSGRDEKKRREILSSHWILFYLKGEDDDARFFFLRRQCHVDGGETKWQTLCPLRPAIGG